MLLRMPKGEIADCDRLHLKGSERRRPGPVEIIHGINKMAFQYGPVVSGGRGVLGLLVVYAMPSIFMLYCALAEGLSEVRSEAEQ